MSMQQMIGMIYKSSGGGGGDSAFLNSPEGVTGGTELGGSASLWFNYDTYIRSDNELNPVTWYTGTGAITDYEVKYTESSRTGGGSFTGGGAQPGTWYVLGGMNPLQTLTTNPPMWLFEAPGTSNSNGHLAIRNKNTLIELANVSCSFTIGNAA